MPITKEEFSLLYSEDISKKKYDEIINKIDTRFGEIVLLIYPKICNGQGWFDYGNCDYQSEGQSGHFDLNEYEENITIGGEHSVLLAPYYDDIPTRWLWTDDAEILAEFKSEINKYNEEKEEKKKLAKSKAQQLKEKKAEMKRIISAKLSKEELGYIDFK